MSQAAASSSSPAVVLRGHNDTVIWNMSAAERTRRMARAAKLPVEGALPRQGPALLINLGFVFDPVWLDFVAARPDHVVTFQGRPVLAHLASGGSQTARCMAAAMARGEPMPDAPGMEVLATEQGIDLHNTELRKREQPFLMPLEPETAHAAERASYYGAYKGVTDLLTKYLWPEFAFHLTRFAARLGLTPNAVTAIGAALCLAAMFAFFEGHYWLGFALGFGFMVLDTVDGKLARCTITSSSWGNIFDHGIDLIHPPFWWWAWGAGLAAYGRPLPQETFLIALATIIIGYVLQRMIEGMFIGRYGMHIHVWRRVDSQFRLITARRNPNMVILFVFLLFGRPDLGFLAIAWWTVLSLIFHLVRLVQASVTRARGRPVLSWLS